MIRENYIFSQLLFRIIFFIFSFSWAKMALMTHCYLPFLQSHPHPLPSSALLYHPSHFMPLRRATSFLLLRFCSFSQILPSLRYWVRLQLFVGGQNNYIETLIETQKTPCLMSWMAPDRCWFSASVCPSVTKKRICYHSWPEFGSQRVLPFQSTGLWEVRCSQSTSF